MLNASIQDLESSQSLHHSLIRVRHVEPSSPQGETIRMGVVYDGKSILKYNAKKLRGASSLAMCCIRGSSFTGWRMWRDTASIVLLAFAVTPLIDWAYYGTLPVAADDLLFEGLKEFVDILHSFLPFVMGLYMSLCVGRWWSIRNDCIGGLWGAMADLTFYLSTYLPGDGANKEARELIHRWCVLSHELVYKQARGEDDLSDLVDDNLCTQEECDLLQHMPSRACMVWVWISSYLCHLAYGNGPSRIPYPVTIFPQLQALCTKARGSIGASFAYTDTQLPFRYVHFLSVMVWVHSVAQGVISGFVFSKYWRQNRAERAVFEFCFLIFYPATYFALLHMCEKMSNPLRAATSFDFPRKKWTQYMHMENKGFFQAGSNPPYLNREIRLPRWTESVDSSSVLQDNMRL